MNRHIVCVLSLVATSCGDAGAPADMLATATPEPVSDVVTNPVVAVNEKGVMKPAAVATPTTISFMVENRDQLPSCNSEVYSQLAYSEADESFFVCTVNAKTGIDFWKPVSIQGPQGAAGINGVDGQVGATGAQGVAGVAGPVGATGATGAQGAVGATGATGAQGAVGATGATGAQGVAGVAGSVGATGATGAQGAVGAAGAQGVAGTNGVDATHRMVKRTECAHSSLATPQEVYTGVAFAANSTQLPSAYWYAYYINRYEFSDGSVYEEYGGNTHTQLMFNQNEWNFPGDTVNPYFDNTIYFMHYLQQNANIVVVGSNMVVTYEDSLGITGWVANATKYRSTFPCVVTNY